MNYDTTINIINNRLKCSDRNTSKAHPEKYAELPGPYDGQWSECPGEQDKPADLDAFGLESFAGYCLLIKKNAELLNIEFWKLIHENVHISDIVEFLWMVDSSRLEPLDILWMVNGFSRI